MSFLSAMEALKVLLLCVLATSLACDLTETEEEKANKELVETYIQANRKNVTDNPRYRLHYHVAPPIGWMNDPNGFSFFKGNYHLFYQFYPFNSSTGNMHWGHVVSEDLVTWKQLPIALLPDTKQCFSGSAIVKDGTLILMYTAHLSLGEDNNDESQYLAFSNDGVVFNKYIYNPVISQTPDSINNFRDPKVWKHGDNFYVVIGSQTSDKKGRVLIYKSSDMGSWEYLNAVNASNDEMGFMWECPDFFELNGSYVLLMSPQGINASGDRYQNLFQTGYIIGSFNYETGEFMEKVAFQEIDYGHDFYATQTMEKDGKRYLIAWMGSWDGQFLERSDDWAGAMTIVRELTLHENRILMKPVDAISTLRGTAVHTGTLAATETISTLNRTGELIVNFNMSQDLSLSFKGSSDEEAVITLSWNAESQKVALDRDGVIRQGEWIPVSSESWRIFLDASSIEVFCGEGEVVFSSRVYPNGAWVVTNAGTQAIDVTAYPLKNSVPE